MKIIGHRGARALAPENTIASIEAGLNAGADMIEVDVRVDASGTPVLSHNRLAASLSSADRLDTTAPCTLRDAVQTIGTRAVLMIEVKRGTPAAPVVEIVQQALAAGSRPDQFWFGSKQARLLRELHAKLPDIPTIVIEPWSGVRATYRARQLGTTRLAMNQLFFWSGFVRMISRRYELYAYTVNSPRRGAWLQQHGVRGIFTDDPSAFSKAIAPGGDATNAPDHHLPQSP